MKSQLKTFPLPVDDNEEVNSDDGGCRKKKKKGKWAITPSGGKCQIHPISRHRASTGISLSGRLNLIFRASTCDIIWLLWNNEKFKGGREIDGIGVDLP